jgi:Mannosyl-glycoprotein endo-beta-N-acetylglucosaminidase
MSRSRRRAVAAASAASVTVALLVAAVAPAWAASTPAGSPTTTSTAAGDRLDVAGDRLAAVATTTTSTTSTTTTTVPKPTTTTTRPRSTTTTKAPSHKATTRAPARTTSTTRPRPTTTTTPKPPKKPKKPKKGVPKVPVGAPHTHAKPGPPPDPTTVLRQVNADLAQLTAIADYAQERAAVANSQQAVTAATAVVGQAVLAQSDAQAAQQAAQSGLDAAAARVRTLALAAYMGVGFLTPAAGPQQVQQSSTGTVSSPGGLTGAPASDALEMLRLVAQRERHDLQTSRVTVRRAGRATTAAAQQVADARSGLTTAQAALAGTRQTLGLVTRAATTPGLAASLDLPALLARQSAGSDPTLPPDGAASGLSALAATAAPPISPAPASAGTSTAATATTATTVAASNALGGSSTAPTVTSPSILGPSVLSNTEMASWFASTRRKPHITVPISQLANDYSQAGQQTHVRADLAFAQSIVETGFFSFPAGGQLTRRDNNFAGIGACDSCAHGWTFPNALTGVTAQMQLLDAYASPDQVPTSLLGNIGIGGCCPTWLELAGTWASSLQYGVSIMTVYQHMLAWVIPQRLMAAGLLAPPRPGPPHARVQVATPATPATPGTGTAGTAGAGGTAGPRDGAGRGGTAGPTGAGASLPAQPALAAHAVKPVSAPQPTTTAARG